ncbi:hypothetical protein Tco_0354539, partial [Tanacetum coccineum]
MFLNKHNAVYVAPSLKQKLFSIMKIGFLGEHVPLFDTMLLHDQPGQGEGPTLFVESQHTPIVSPHTSQPTPSQPTASHSISSPQHSTQKPTSEPTSPKSGRTAESEVEGVQEERQEVEYHFDQTLLQQEITP